MENTREEMIDFLKKFRIYIDVNNRCMYVIFDVKNNLKYNKKDIIKNLFYVNELLINKISYDKEEKLFLQKIEFDFSLCDNYIFYTDNNLSIIYDKVSMFCKLCLKILILSEDRYEII